MVKLPQRVTSQKQLPPYKRHFSDSLRCCVTFYCIYPKYWDTLPTYRTCPQIWNTSPFYYLLMFLKYCCMYGSVPWSGSTLFAKAYLSQYLGHKFCICIDVDQFWVAIVVQICIGIVVCQFLQIYCIVMALCLLSKFHFRSISCEWRQKQWNIIKFCICIDLNQYSHIYNRVRALDYCQNFAYAFTLTRSGLGLASVNFHKYTTQLLIVNFISTHYLGNRLLEFDQDCISRVERKTIVSQMIVFPQT